MLPVQSAAGIRSRTNPFTDVRCGTLQPQSKPRPYQSQEPSVYQSLPGRRRERFHSAEPVSSRGGFQARTPFGTAPKKERDEARPFRSVSREPDQMDLGWGVFMRH